MDAAAHPTRPVIERAAIVSGREGLCLMVEYHAPTPLWVRGGNLAVSGLGLTQELIAALIAWQRHFDAHFFVDRLPYWDDVGAEQWHFAEGPRLHDRLVAALPDADITLDMWAYEYDPKAHSR